MLSRGLVVLAAGQLASGALLRPAALDLRPATSATTVRTRVPVASILPDVRGLWSRLSGAPNSGELFNIADEDSAMGEDIEFVPQVLVVGATGRTGLIIVRKLLLRGFRVAVLVRSLSTDTLNRLGSGVSYSYGDMTDYNTLLDAMEDVDKVVFVASSDDPEREELGLRNILRALQDTRTFTYGGAEATKLSLFKFRREADFDAWRIESAGDEVAERLAQAGLAVRKSISYWKRSDAHRNGVFVGSVFDTYLGSAMVSCRFADAPAPNLELPGQPAADPSAGVGAVVDDVTAEETDESALDLGEYSGIILKGNGDGQKYTMILRTAQYDEDGLEYQHDFKTRVKGFTTARLPFSGFRPFRNGKPLALDAAPELDRRAMVGMGMAFYPIRNDPTKGEGNFYLSFAHIKAYRERDEPEVVYLSGGAAANELAAGDAAKMEAPASGGASGAAAGAAAGLGGKGISSDAAAARRESSAKCERVVRSSGLTYFIVRPAKLDNLPGGVRRLVFSQGAAADATARGSVSRADVAEVVVRSLLDPRACNVACTLSESDYLPAAGENQDISKMLEVMRPEQETV